jgi:hypothetical protein
MMVSGVRFQAKGAWRKGLNRRTMEKRIAEPQNIEYRMSKGGFVALCLNEKAMSAED